MQIYFCFLCIFTFDFCGILLLTFVVFYFWLLWFTKDAKGCRCFMGSPIGANGVHPVGESEGNGRTYDLAWRSQLTFGFERKE